MHLRNDGKPPFSEPAPPARPRILVVEDSPELNLFLTEALSRQFDVDSAMDGAAGLAQALASPPDLILTDVMMPRMRGDALVREVRARRELDDVPIVLLTANVDDELRVRLLREGAQDYLAKPFSAKELLVRVGNLVDVKRARQVLRDELAMQGRDLESMARALASRTRQLEGALEATRVARENAERAGEAKNLFLSVASHELRTPIAALQLRVDRLRRAHHAIASHEHDETFRGVQTAIDRLTMLVESLLQYTRVQSSALPIEPSRFNPCDVIDQVIEEWRGGAERKGLALAHERPTHPISMESDMALFRTAVSNLIDNALKFTDQGRVDVSVEERAGFVKVNVRDTGPGVPAADRGRIFEPFQHLEPAERKHTPGVGLGLALVREVTTALRGSVELVSEVGSGSTFTMILPLAGPTTSNDRDSKPGI
jgi:signal transduction histidine kinase